MIRFNEEKNQLLKATRGIGFEEILDSIENGHLLDGIANQLDLIKIKAKADRSKIPYDTLLSAVLYGFAEGKREVSIK